MRQTRTKYYDEETQFSSDAIIIGAHCNSDDRKQRCKELLSKIRERFPDYVIFLCSHIPVDDDIFKLSDYVIFNKNNPTVNYDLIDKRTDWKVFAIYQPGIGQQVNRPVHSNGYGHYMQVFDGLTMAIGNRMKKMHYMSYDVSFDVLDKIKLHSDFLEHYEVVNYTFRDDNFISSEFFSINDDGAKKSILQKITFDDYINTGMGDFGTENVYANMFNDCNVKTMGFFHTDDRKDPWVIGDFTALPLNTSDSKISKLATSIDGLVVIPYKQNDDTVLVLSNGYNYENDGVIEKIELIFYDEQMNHVDTTGTEKLGLHFWAQFYPDSNVRYVEVKVNQVSRLTFDLHDRKNYGWISK